MLDEFAQLFACFGQQDATADIGNRLIGLSQGLYNLVGGFVVDGRFLQRTGVFRHHVETVRRNNL